MKKFLLIASLMLALTGFSFAQTTPAATGPKKKDGTADMRYKANKTAAKPPVHTKKDGTPDKRFKENKDAPKKSGK